MPFAPLFTVAEALSRNLSAMAAARSSAALPAPTMPQARFKELIGFRQLEELQTRFETAPLADVLD